MRIACATFCGTDLYHMKRVLLLDNQERFNS